MAVVKQPGGTKGALAVLIMGVLMAGCGSAESGGGSARSNGNGGSETTQKEPSDGWEALLASEDECPGQERADASDDELRTAAICLIDHARAERDLTELDRASTLHQSASGKVDDIVRCEDFSHTACGRDAMHWFDEVGYRGSCRRVATAENLGFGERELGSPRDVVLGWLESPPHRRNMLSNRWSEQGIARQRLDTWSATLGGEKKRSLQQASIWVSHFGNREGC